MDEIKSNISKLLDIYEKKHSTKISPALLVSMMEELYCNPDFSITVLADKFQVSIAYISSFFKRELNQHFSEYLWMLRLNKAQELLKNSNMTVDEISIAVGYINPTSFRRKFKEKTGLTPSQFRQEYAKK